VCTLVWRLLAEVYREKILTVLSLPPTAICEYRSNAELLVAASTPKDVHPGMPGQAQNHGQGQQAQAYGQGANGHERNGVNGHGVSNGNVSHGRERTERGDRVDGDVSGTLRGGRNGWGNAGRRET
jgi:hypothetical protein